MPDTQEAARVLRAHFASVSPEQFVDNVRRFSPEIIDGDSAEKVEVPGEDECVDQLMLFQPQPSSIALDAYLACALTGLNSEQRQLMFQLSDVVAAICGEYNIKVYEPRKKTDPVHNPTVLDAEVFAIDRGRVLSSDLLILLSHYPSTGSGEELDFAYNALVPIIVISHSDNHVSRMVTGIPSLKLQITYSEPEDLRRELRDRLVAIRPVLTERKLAFSQYDVNLVGTNVRLLREKLGLSREEIASAVPLLTVECLRQIEESVDRTSNPSLLQLRQIAAILKTTVADLVEPNMSERLVAFLDEWMSGRQAARFPGMTTKDRNRLLRRILLRVIDSLEDE
ncbi:MAG TPA: helix-turn-helix domain-containing protein [Chloroflexota bacterium]|nr:helix-turn-helix domain-containing protein [Chloroflexota bacterium]